MLDPPLLLFAGASLISTSAMIERFLQDLGLCLAKVKVPRIKDEVSDELADVGE